MKYCLVLALLCLLILPVAVHAEGADEAYIGIYAKIQQADGLRDSGKSGPAMEAYLEAENMLKRFKATNPGWNPKIIQFRGDYVQSQIKQLTSGAPAEMTTTNAPSEKAVEAAPPVTPGTNEAAKPAPVLEDNENPMKMLEQKVRTLEAEKALLESKLKEALAVKPAATDPGELVKAEEKIKELQKENDLLQVTLNEAKSTPAKGEAAEALKQENAVLKKQLADLQKAKISKAGKEGSPERELAEMQARIAVLESERDSLRLEKTVLDGKLKSQAGSTAKMSTSASDELTALQAKLKIYESQKVPYTPEELALFNRPAGTLEAAATTAAKPSGAKPADTKPPAGSSALIGEARRYFMAHDFEKAEGKYLEVLKLAPQNIFTLANLAAIELEMNHLDDAEKNINTAVSLAPNDSYSLSVLGRIKFQKDDYDSALTALSKAAEIDPNSAEVQNYLGITLSQKGMRSQAENALRKAIQLDPGYGSAHNNLAVIYATQKPPMLELARWHYQKARAAGHPANPELEKMLGTSGN